MWCIVLVTISPGQLFTWKIPLHHHLFPLLDSKITKHKAAQNHWWGNNKTRDRGWSVCSFSEIISFFTRFLLSTFQMKYLTTQVSLLPSWLWNIPNTTCPALLVMNYWNKIEEMAQSLKMWVVFFLLCLFGPSSFLVEKSHPPSDCYALSDSESIQTQCHSMLLKKK